MKVQSSQLAPSKPAFEALEREATLAARVVGRLEEMIVAHELRPGDRLPPERELAQQFGVSRTVIREAITHLSAKSLLQSAPGGGALVRVPHRDHVAQSMTLFLRAGEREMPGAHVHEVRRMLEIEIVGHAAARRDDADLEAGRALLSEMRPLCAREDEGTLETLVRNDVEFHSLLGRATHNPLFGVLLLSVADIMLEVRRLGLRLPGSRPNALKHHQAIWERVEARDEAGARRAMHAHLLDSEAVMRRALEEKQA